MPAVVEKKEQIYPDRSEVTACVAQVEQQRAERSPRSSPTGRMTALEHRQYSSPALSLGRAPCKELFAELLSNLSSSSF